MSEGPGTPANRAPQAWWALLGAALFGPTVVWLAAPNNIVLSNLLDIPYRLTTIGLFLVGFAGGAVVSVAAFLLAPRFQLARGAARLSVWLGVCVLLADVLTAAQQSGQRPAEIVATLDAMVLAGSAIILLFMVRFGGLVSVFSVLGPLLLVYTVGSHVWRIEQRRATQAARTAAAEAVRSTEAAGNPAGNIYHLVLDAFQTDAFLQLAVADPTFRFPGFTQYPEFTAHYARTNHSVPNALTGRFYRANESMWAWREEAFSGGLWAGLVEANVQLHLYPHYPPYCTPLAATCQDTITYADSFQTRRDEASPTDITVDLWFLGLLPPSVRAWINRPFTVDPKLPRGGDEYYGFSLTSVLFPAPPRPAQMPADLPAFTHTAAWSLRNLDRLLADEAQRPGRGQYVFFHAILPHWPFVVGADCGYLGREATTRPLEAFMDQSVCALHLVQRLVNRLRELGRLDDALIVVHGDHGGKGGALMLQYDAAQWPGPTYAGPLEWPDGDRIDSATWPHHMVDLYRRTLLLVKFPHAREFATASAPAEMIDLAPTMLRHVGADSSDFVGIPLQDFPEAPDRELTFFASNAHPDAHVPNTFSTYVYRAGRWEHVAEVPTAR